MKKGMKSQILMDSEKGFTLIEVMVAMAIATVGLLGVALMQGTAIQGNNFGKETTQATILAQEALEDLSSSRLDPHNTLTTPLSIGNSSDVVNEYGVPTAGGLFTRTWTIAPHKLSNGLNSAFSRRVTITVTWGDADVQFATANTPLTHSVTLSTITRGALN